MYKKDAQASATKIIRESGRPMLQEDTKIALFHLEKKKEKKRLERIKAVFLWTHETLWTWDREKNNSSQRGRG